MPRRAPSTRACPAVAIAVAVVTVVGLADPATAQYRGSTQQQRGRRTAGGADFPTWERDVDSAELHALPVGRPGRYEVAFAVDAGGTPLGVASTTDGQAVALFLDGTTRWIDRDGAETEGPPAGFEPAHPPVACGDGVLVAGASGVALLRRDGVAWSLAAESADVRAPLLTVAGVVRARADGVLAWHDAATGALVAQAASGEASTLATPAALPGVVIGGNAAGELFALDAATGSELWRRAIGERIDAVSVDLAAAYATGRGASGRSRASAPLIVRLDLLDGGRRAAEQPAWRRRMGGDCPAAPVPFDAAVIASCFDTYVHAVGRKRGVEAWRTDLPARLPHAPVVAPGRLDCVLPLTGYVVALAPENGAVLGWSALEDADETFVGPAAAIPGDAVVAATSFGRLIGLKWSWDELPEYEEPRGPRLRPGEEPGTAIRTPRAPTPVVR